MESGKDTSAPESSVTELPTYLAKAVIARFGGDSVENIEKLSGGASCEIWSFDWTDDSGTTTGLILRRDLGRNW